MNVIVFAVSETKRLRFWRASAQRLCASAILMSCGATPLLAGADGAGSTTANHARPHLFGSGGALTKITSLAQNQRRGAAPGETTLFSQRVVADDTGAGPEFLLAASASCTFGSAAADDFTLSAAAYLTRLTWDGLYFGAGFDFPPPGGVFDITIYRDNGAGNVGAVVAIIKAPAVTRSPSGRAPVFGFHPVYTFSAPVDPPLLLQGGQRYWLSINGDTAGVSGPTFGWMVSSEGNATATPEPDQPLINQQITCADLPVAMFTPGGPLKLDADLAFTLLSGCAPGDCDCNGVPDAEEIALGLAADCNGNGIPDQCDIAMGVSSDCDGDGVPDECRLMTTLSLSSPSLSPIGFASPQSFVIASAPAAGGDVFLGVAARADLSGANESLKVLLNGVELAELFANSGSDCPTQPDMTQISIPADQFNALVAGADAVFTFSATGAVNPQLCNGEAAFVIMAIEYPLARTPDCNGNGVLDQCDIASGFSQDCNGDGVPDECQLQGVTTVSSGELAPIGAGSPQRFAPASLPRALGDVEFSFSARADLSSFQEWIEVMWDGVSLGRVFQFSGEDCAAEPTVASLHVPMDVFNAAIDHNGAALEMVASGSVNPSLCLAGSSIAVTFRYLAEGGGDCDGDGVPDACAIASGLVLDVNGNGLPDTCELLADLSGDGVVNVEDLAILLGLWGSAGPLGDLSGDGVVNATDLAMLLSAF